MNEPAASAAAGAPDAEALVFNPFDPAYRSNPYPFFSRLREEAPLFAGPLGMPVLSRHADCVAMLRHPYASSDSRNSEMYEQFQGQQVSVDADEEMLGAMQTFLFMDPPDHTRLRGLVSKAFTPRVVEEMRPRITQLVRELLEGVEARGSCELIEDLAYPLPVMVISDMLGVPREDAETFKGWSRELARSLDPEINTPPEVLERRQQAALAFVEYFSRLIEERRKMPREDLLSGLIAAEESGDRLNERELLATCILLLVAGHETTVNLIGNGALALLRHRDQLDLLRGDPSLIRTAVEEALRFDPPVQLTARTALQDIELPCGTIRKGQQAVLLIGAANRDPRQFDDPERFDISRTDNRHLAFGMGIHFCLGAPLARVEGQIALGELARRFPKLQLATDEPEYKENITLRGLKALPLVVA